jgi:GAF domain-containing protein
MKHVSLAAIERAIDVVDNLNDDQLEATFEKYALTQQMLLEYVMSAPIEYENEELEGLLVYYFCLINECFSQEGIKFREVTEEDIDEMQEPFEEMLDQYFDDEDEEILESFCDQPELAQFMAMEVSTDDEDGSTMSDETASQLFTVTIAMISLMNRAIEA